MTEIIISCSLLNNNNRFHADKYSQLYYDPTPLTESAKKQLEEEMYDGSPPDRHDQQIQQIQQRPQPGQPQIPPQIMPHTPPSQRTRYNDDLYPGPPGSIPTPASIMSPDVRHSNGPPMAGYPGPPPGYHGGSPMRNPPVPPSYPGGPGPGPGGPPFDHRGPPPGQFFNGPGPGPGHAPPGHMQGYDGGSPMRMGMDRMGGMGMGPGGPGGPMGGPGGMPGGPMGGPGGMGPGGMDFHHPNMGPGAMGMPGGMSPMRPGPPGGMMPGMPGTPDMRARMGRGMEEGYPMM
jgi:hypothetical protein